MTALMTCTLLGVVAAGLMVYGASGILRRRLRARGIDFEGVAAVIAGFFLMIFSGILMALIPWLYRML